MNTLERIYIEAFVAPFEISFLHRVLDMITLAIIWCYDSVVLIEVFKLLGKLENSLTFWIILNN